MQFFILPASDAGQWTTYEENAALKYRGTTKKEKAACSVVELAGVLPIDRVIKKANLNRPCMVDAISPPVP